ncbi:MAG TPA: hypothetical protein VIF10_11540 [Methylobacter sp.]
MNVQSIAWKAVHNSGYNHPFVFYPMNFEADVKNFDAGFKAVHNLGNGDNYPFVVYSMDFDVDAKNSDGN